MDAKLKNVIVDFGGVLVNLDKRRTVLAFQELGLDVSAYIGEYAQSGLFQKLEKGELSSSQFCEALRQQTHLSATDKQICDAWNQMLLDIPPARLDKLLVLREHYMVYLLSNTNEIHWDFACRNLFPHHGFYVEDYFERIYLSYQMNCCKPEADIFDATLRDANLLAAETLFIDDSADNCATARALGIHTHHVCVEDDWMDLF